MDYLADIFERQRKHNSEFRPLQISSGSILGNPLPLSPDVIPDCTELHLGLHWFNLELREVLFSLPDDRSEEIADCFHFLVDFAILCGLTEDDVIPLPDDIPLPEERLAYMLSASEQESLTFERWEENARFCILAALNVADVLKNKPWKQTIRATNQAEFRRRLYGVFYWFGAVVRTAGMSAEDLYQAYISKSEINHQRVRDGV